jgi:CheY-like chemotaxis protein
MQFMRSLIFPGGFVPHGYCYLWTPSLIGLHVVSDSLIALSYLLKLKLPKVDGLSVLRTLREDRRTRWMPVIILTSSKEERDPTASYDHCENSYIQKPVNFAQFQETLHTVALYWRLLNQPPPRHVLTSGTKKSA